MGRNVRVTLTFPKELWDEVKRTVPAGEQSRLIAEATAQLLATRKRAQGVRRLKVLRRRGKTQTGTKRSFSKI